jgi:hypothetical protein
MEVSSFGHLLLQAAYGDYQIGALENFHQLVEDTLIVLRPGPKIFFQYELSFVDCLKSQLLIGHFTYPSKLLISHLLLPIINAARRKKERAGNQAEFWEKYLRASNHSIKFCFKEESRQDLLLSVASAYPMRSNPKELCVCPHRGLAANRSCEDCGRHNTSRVIIFRMMYLFRLLDRRLAHFARLNDETHRKIFPPLFDMRRRFGAFR